MTAELPEPAGSLHTDLIMDPISELKRHGYRQTAPRTFVLQVLEASGGHMTATQIADAVEHRKLPLNRSTVYRTLEMLSEIGIIKGSQIGRSVSYELLHDSDSHHHLVCSNCQDTVHIKDEKTDKALRREAAGAGYTVSEIQVLVSGLCSRCRA